ncbi:dTDP-4-dehydrorhamnose 3,5-epimerase [Altericista sp. CCNU0014]|uniref:dTDP-4-dehydrorhamnose 3,5-epimerase n=1 Tax=Altericista sp. CCNU0014 TaxID=3082949 RepID=UPI00384EF4CC
MSLKNGIQVRPLESIRGGMAEFYTPQASHETMLVNIPAGTIDELFVHHFQTDQILVVRGSFVLVGLQNRQYQYIALSESVPAVVTIPPGIPHGAINLSEEPCVIVNAVLRHGASHPTDYRPMKPPFSFDLDAVRAALGRLLTPLSA